jgi:hypothetical protein
MIASEFEREAGILRVFEIEGRLTEHEFIGGRYEDMIMAGCTRQRFEDFVCDGPRKLWADGLFTDGTLTLRDGGVARSAGDLNIRGDST